MDRKTFYSLSGNCRIFYSSLRWVWVQRASRLEVRNAVWWHNRYFCFSVSMIATAIDFKYSCNSLLYLESDFDFSENRLPYWQTCAYHLIDQRIQWSFFSCWQALDLEEELTAFNHSGWSTFREYIWSLVNNSSINNIDLNCI